jgi:starch-binding outer membrane protein SusE/F
MNKYLKVSIGLLLVAAVVVQNCTKEKELNLNVTSVTSLKSPEDNASVELEITNLSTGKLLFQWDQAYAEDGSLVLYDVVFDQVGGDFSKPFYVIVSDGKGVQNRLTLPYGNLNDMAGAGGAAFLETKKFIWTARSSKGSNIKLASASRTIEVSRPLGIKNVPTVLYLTGSGTEGGTNLANAVQMTQIATGVFEIYTTLSAGTYQMVSANTGTPNTYFSKVVDGTTIVAEDGQNTWTGATGQYRFSVNFNTFGVTTPLQITGIGFWMGAINDTSTMKYQGRGLWQADKKPLTLPSVSWGAEERYKYRVYLGDGTTEFWGYQNSDDGSGRDGNYPNGFPEGYNNAFKQPDTDSFNYSWKFDKPAVNSKDVRLQMKFQPPAYSNQYIVLN